MDKIEEKSGLKSFDNMKIESSGKATFKSKEKSSKRKTR